MAIASAALGLLHGLLPTPTAGEQLGVVLETEPGSSEERRKPEQRKKTLIADVCAVLSQCAPQLLFSSTSVCACL